MVITMEYMVNMVNIGISIINGLADGAITILKNVSSSVGKDYPIYEMEK